MAGYNTLLSVLATLLVAIEISECEVASNCRDSITTVSGPYSLKGKLCAGALVFKDDFDKLDLKIWQHESTLTGGGVSILYICFNKNYF